MFVAVEGWGKTTYGALAPDAAILMAKGETGYLTLLSGGLVPKLPHVTLESWPQTLAMIDDLIADPQGRKTFVFDAAGGFERQCHEFVCQRDFEGDWGEKGFASYGRGPEVSVSEWIKLLVKLDALHQKHAVGIIVLSHAKVKGFKNPDGPDYDRYVSDLHEKSWSAINRWADMVLFGTHVTAVVGTKGDVMKKGKGQGGTARVVYTERRAAWDAKNRFNLPESIDIPSDRTLTYSTIHDLINTK